VVQWKLYFISRAFSNWLVVPSIAIYCLTCSIEKVHQYMQEFFDNAQLLLVTDKEDQSLIVELCLLCIHCLEVLCCCFSYI